MASSTPSLVRPDPCRVEFVGLAMPNGKLAPNLAKRGIRRARRSTPTAALVYFNMEDPVVGGYTPEKVALRRAIGLAHDVDHEIRLVRRGQAMPAQSPVLADTVGYDAAFKSEISDYDPARAKALLDLYGYIDRDGDGWRELPDGKPLVIVARTLPDQRSREFDELWNKNLDAIGIRSVFQPAKWPRT